MNKDICPLCNSTDNHKLFTTNGYDMMRCTDCGLLHIYPFPQSEQERFDGVSNNSLEDITVIGPEQYSHAREVYYQDLFSMIKPALAGAKTLLDIGCGTGALLKLAGQCGVSECDGLELNSARAEYARKNTHREIVEKPIEHFETDKKYDVITLIDVLSHIYSFDKLFESVKALLNKDGRFIIKTGQFANEIKRGSVFDWEVPDHLHFLGINTIDYLAEKYNCEIVSHKMIAHADELYTKERFLTKGRSKVRNIIKLFIAYTPFAINIMKKQYLKKYGKNVFSSVIVLREKLEL